MMEGSSLGRKTGEKERREKLSAEGEYLREVNQGPEPSQHWARIPPLRYTPFQCLAPAGPAKARGVRRVVARTRSELHSA